MCGELFLLSYVQCAKCTPMYRLLRISVHASRSVLSAHTSAGDETYGVDVDLSTNHKPASTRRSVVYGLRTVSLVDLNPQQFHNSLRQKILAARGLTADQKFPLSFRSDEAGYCFIGLCPSVCSHNNRKTARQKSVYLVRNVCYSVS